MLQNSLGGTRAVDYLVSSYRPRRGVTLHQDQCLDPFPSGNVVGILVARLDGYHYTRAHLTQCFEGVAISDIKNYMKFRPGGQLLPTGELEARKNRVQDLEKVNNEMAMKQELQKKAKKRKLREDEIVCPTSKPVYKWRTERKR
ncbi:probable U3 small nucleolar RNA-associated protein 11 [Tanacetum coccineum]